MNILVLGGTRFFGRELVKHLVKSGHRVTVATRGIHEIPFVGLVKTLKVERTDLVPSIVNQKESWDIVYDQICYCSRDAQVATEAFSGKIGKLIMASSEAVYPDGYKVSEKEFKPRKYPLKMDIRSDFAYAEGKKKRRSLLCSKCEIRSGTSSHSLHFRYR